MMLQLSLLAALALHVVSGNVIHQEPALPVNWQRIENVELYSAQHEIRMLVSLKEKNLKALKEIALAVSDPKNPRYGQYLSSEELDAVSTTSFSGEVTAWLESSACSIANMSSSVLEVTCTLTQASDWLATSFRQVKNVGSNQVTLRASAYSLPVAVDQAVFVQGLHGLPLPPRNQGPQPVPFEMDVNPTHYGPPPSLGGKCRSDEFDGSTVSPPYDICLPACGHVGNTTACPSDYPSSNPTHNGLCALGLVTDNGTDLGVFCVDTCKKGDCGEGATCNFIRPGDTEGFCVFTKSEQGKPAGQDGQIIRSKIIQDLSVSAAPPAVTPTVLATTYGIAGVTVDRSSKNRQAVVEFQLQNYQKSDLTSFFKDFVPDAQQGDEKVNKNVGAWTPGDEPGTTGTGTAEGSLDIQYIMGVAPGVKTEFWYYATSFDFCLCVKNWTTTILATSDGPLVHSVSYGFQGDLSTVGCTQADDIEADFVKIATMGVSILVASGDSGSGYDEKTGKIWPSWPASSPWVTAVGSTAFSGNMAGNPEMAPDQFGSGGGFSGLFDQSPDAAYQTAAVKAYTSNPPADPHFPPASAFSASGRATPDMSTLGEGFQVYVQGGLYPIWGTSASTPAFAGMVSLLNEARLQAGQPALGFLNQWIYQNADAFTDVVLGTNAIGRDAVPAKLGFNATTGWDPVTGLGTPLFGKLLKAALN